MMITISIANQVSQSAQQPQIAYRVAGHTIVCNEPLWPLAPFRIRDSSSVSVTLNNVEHVDFKRPRLTRTVGWLGDRVRHLKTVEHQAGTEIYIEELGRILITADGGRIELPAWRDDAHRALLIEAAVGPALCLALAMKGVFCLHASAVVCHGRATLFCGASGAGKSTLAQRLPGHPGFDIRLTDDVSALALGDEGAQCLGHFPQLKLGIDEHCNNAKAEAVPVNRVVLLRPVMGDDDFGSGTIDPAASVITLARHTVASRLFPRALLKRHLSFCSRLANAVETIEMHYPHTANGVDGVARVLSGTTLQVASR